MTVLSRNGTCSGLGRGGAIFLILALLSFSGCVASQINSESHVKPSEDQFAQTRAYRSSEMSSSRDEEWSRVKGKLQQVLRQMQKLQAKHEDLTLRSAQLERHVKRLEQRSSHTARLGDESTIPVSKNIDIRRDSQVEVELIRSIVDQITDLSKRVQTLEKR